MMKKKGTYQSRYDRKRKRKQTLILNSLIAVVFIAIIWVGASMLFDNKDEQASTSSQTNKEQFNEEDSETEPSNSEETQEDDMNPDGENTEPEAEEEPDESDPSDDGGHDDGPWEPIGTEQQEPHVSSYDSESTDWKEKIEALSYATGVSVDDNTLLWLGNNGGNDNAFGVVRTPKDGSNPYVVYLEWVTEKGWKPTEVVRMNELSEARQQEIRQNYE
jgi:cytoskeletal protein RodZ